MQLGLQITAAHNSTQHKDNHFKKRNKRSDKSQNTQSTVALQIETIFCSDTTIGVI